MSEKAKKETPAAVAAAGVTPETKGADTASNSNPTANDETQQLKSDLQAANERAQAAEAKLNEVATDLTAKLLELNNDFDAQVQRAANAESDLAAALLRADEAEAGLRNFLAGAHQKVVADRTLYTNAGGDVFEFTQSEFRYKGEKHKAEEVTPELAEELIAAKSFILIPSV